MEYRWYPRGYRDVEGRDRGSICGEPCGVTNYLGTVAALSGHRDTLHDSAVRGRDHRIRPARGFVTLPAVGTPEDYL